MVIQSGSEESRMHQVVGIIEILRYALDDKMTTSLYFYTHLIYFFLSNSCKLSNFLVSKNS